VEKPFRHRTDGIGYGQPLSILSAMRATEGDILATVAGARLDGRLARAAGGEELGGEFRDPRGDWSPFWHDVIDFVGLEKLSYMMYDTP